MERLKSTNVLSVGIDGSVNRGSVFQIKNYKFGADEHPNSRIISKTL